MCIRKIIHFLFIFIINFVNIFGHDGIDNIGEQNDICCRQTHIDNIRAFLSSKSKTTIEENINDKINELFVRDPIKDIRQLIHDNLNKNTTNIDDTKIFIDLVKITLNNYEDFINFILLEHKDKLFSIGERDIISYINSVIIARFEKKNTTIKYGENKFINNLIQYIMAINLPTDNNRYKKYFTTSSNAQCYILVGSDSEGVLLKEFLFLAFKVHCFYDEIYLGKVPILTTEQITELFKNNEQSIGYIIASYNEKIKLNNIIEAQLSKKTCYSTFKHTILPWLMSNCISGLGGNDNTWKNLYGNLYFYKSNIYLGIGINYRLPYKLPILTGGDVYLHILGFNGINFLFFVFTTMLFMIKSDLIHDFEFNNVIVFMKANLIFDMKKRHDFICVHCKYYDNKISKYDILCGHYATIFCLNSISFLTLDIKICHFYSMQFNIGTLLVTLILGYIKYYLEYPYKGLDLPRIKY